MVRFLIWLLRWPKPGPRQKPWESLWLEEQKAAHALPIADLIDHEESDECACKPTVEPVMRHDGSNGWLITHHSLDGREQREVQA